MDKTRAEALLQTLRLAAISSEAAADDCRKNDKDHAALDLAGRAHAYRQAAKLLSEAIAAEGPTEPSLLEALSDELKRAHSLIEIAQRCMSSGMRVLFTEKASMHGHGGLRYDERVAVLTRAYQAKAGRPGCEPAKAVGGAA